MAQDFLVHLGQPNFQLRSPVWLLHLFRIVTWSATAAFFVWGVPGVLESGENLWALWVMGGILVLLSAAFATPGSFSPGANFACDTRGVYVVLDGDEHEFLPWSQVRNIRIDTVLSSGGGSQNGLVIEARVEDRKIQHKLFRIHVLDRNKSRVDADGYGEIGIGNNARSMNRAMEEINRIRRQAGLGEF